MLPFPVSLPAAVITLLLLVDGRSTPSTGAATVPAAVVADDPSIGCAANRATSDAIPFERIDLRTVQPITPRTDSTLIDGPRMFAVIEDSTTWSAVWHVAADSAQPFPVTFGDGVLVLAATRTYETAPAGLRITTIRKCRRTGVTVVSTVETRPSNRVPMAVMMRRRGIDLVRVPRTARLGVVLLAQRVQFGDRDRLGGDGVVGSAVHPLAVTDTTVAAADPNARCVMRQGAWVPIPFRQVDLGSDVTNVPAQGRIIYGPRIQAVVTDSVRWPAAWQAAMDQSYSPDTVRLPDGRDSVVAYSVSPPPIRFHRGDAIVFVASKPHAISPIKLEITSIRRCRRTGVVVVHVMETSPRKPVDYPSRAFLAVRVSRHLVARAPVVFVARSQAVAHVTR